MPWNEKQDGTRSALLLWVLLEGREPETAEWKRGGDRTRSRSTAIDDAQPDPSPAAFRIRSAAQTRGLRRGAVGSGPSAFPAVEAGQRE